MPKSLGYKLGNTPKIHLLRNKGDTKAICGATKNLKSNISVESDWNFVCETCIRIRNKDNSPF